MARRRRRTPPAERVVENAECLRLIVNVSVRSGHAVRDPIVAKHSLMRIACEARMNVPAAGHIGRKACECTVDLKARSRVANDEQPDDRRVANVAAVLWVRSNKSDTTFTRHDEAASNPWRANSHIGVMNDKRTAHYRHESVESEASDHKIRCFHRCFVCLARNTTAPETGHGECEPRAFAVYLNDP